MQHRDILKDEIERMGNTLAQVLAHVLGLKADGRLASEMQQVQDRLRSDAQLDLDALTDMSYAELKAKAMARHLTPDQLEILAQCLLEMGTASDVPTASAQRWLHKALDCLQVADELAEAISLTRLAIRAQVQNALADLA
jgi:hypothetical protein